ncbi:DUF4412 domain-containing protein [Gemmatimonas sp.]
MNRWTRGAAVALLGGICATGRVEAQAFEGSISLRMSGRTPQGSMTQQMEYLVRAGKLRVNMGGQAGGMTMIAVPQEKKLYVLVAAQNAYMEMNLPETAAAVQGANVPAADVKVTRTGRMETVAGLTCEHVEVTSKTGSTDLCLTKALGRFINPLEGMRGAVAPWQQQIANEFPLKVTMPDGTVPLEVTKVERRRLSNDLFAIPDSYTKMSMPARPPVR